MLFDNKVALITGGARGIGLATAQTFLAGGAKVALADIDGENARRAAASLPGKAIGVQADVSAREQVIDMIAQTETQLGPIDIFVSSAAILDDKRFLDSGPADWRKMIDICLYGPMFCLHALLPGMVSRGYGRIVCIASDAARVGQARLSYYAAAKAGVIALVKSVAQEVGTAGVTLNIVSPGATNTPLRQEREAGLRAQMGDEAYSRRQRTVLRMYPTGRLGEPQDPAAAIAFLSSEQAGWITGQILSVNGGFLMP